MRTFSGLPGAATIQVGGYTVIAACGAAPDLLECMVIDPAGNRRTTCLTADAFVRIDPTDPTAGSCLHVLEVSARRFSVQVIAPPDCRIHLVNEDAPPKRKFVAAHPRRRRIVLEAHSPQEALALAMQRWQCPVTEVHIRDLAEVIETEAPLCNA